MNKENDVYEFENKEWIDSLEYIIRNESPERVQDLIERLQNHAQKKGISSTLKMNTPYINTIPLHQEVAYPGDVALEQKIENVIRWNAMAMVVKANKASDGIGGHISSFASSASLYEVGFNHFFRGSDGEHPGDLIYFQGHVAPGMYSRSFVEGRLSEAKLKNFRRELASGGGLSSYPHPRLMPDYWQFPTVSMGIGPISAIYQARFVRYLENHKLIKASDQKIFAFLGDGEMDEPESMGAITLASREKLDNLIFVINCNLQRLDGPVRGNGSIVQELEAAFKGAGWHVVKLLNGGAWDQLLSKDSTGLLIRRLGELVDGERQKLSISDGAYIREHFFGKYPELLALVKGMTDKDIEGLNRGGHDVQKIYNAYYAATNHKDQATVILAQTVKGYGMGDAGEARNIAHQQKKLTDDQMMIFRDRFELPFSDDEVKTIPLFRFPEDSPESKYIQQHRATLGGSVPKRKVEAPEFKMPTSKPFEAFYEGSGDKDVATTMVAVKLLADLLRDKNVKDLIVPIVPDESRTFGMDALFRQVGIYASQGQLYAPVDRESFLYYKEEKDGAILEEGISEAGSMSSFIAAGSAYATHGVNSIPVFIFYSMFGFQRIGDFAWAAADMRCKGFMIGATAGRTTLEGEGLQHQDGQSHLYALSIPGLRAYDPAFAYELSVIFQDGLKRMYADGEEIFYYLTVMNAKYPMPAMPKGVEEGIINGMYKFQDSKKNPHHIRLYGSGAIMTE
ncbi:MAG: pyruvate dehydrogenase (acetyl-transferring), homodimeric type, partial [Bacteroidales bacterium]|nr:pyruvate dehydrogenase (acetyl-transferring), homodimeric type [Bacteroidales bacterium]